MGDEVRTESWPLRCEGCDALVGLEASVCLVNADGLIVATGSRALDTDRRRHRAGMRLLHLACAEDLVRTSMEHRRTNLRNSELAGRARPSRPSVAAVSRHDRRLPA